MDDQHMGIQSLYFMCFVLIWAEIYFQDCLGTARWCRWQCHSLAMNEGRSSGRGMGLEAGRNGAPALYLILVCGSVWIDC